MPWTVHARAAEDIVLLNTHPMKPEEAMDLAHKLARAAQYVRGVQERKRRAVEPAALEALPSFEGVGPSDQDGDVADLDRPASPRG
jgi:hypothetical protein